MADARPSGTRLFAPQVDIVARKIRSQTATERGCASLSKKLWRRGNDRSWHHPEVLCQSPAKAVENLRVEAARLMMEHSRHPIDVIAQQTGFADRDRMRRAFLRTFGQPPQVIRRNVRAEATV